MGRVVAGAVIALFFLLLPADSFPFFGSGSAEAATDDSLLKYPAKVTCGSTIKLRHTKTGGNLRSQDIAYGSGSGQQSVTAYEAAESVANYWIVRGGLEEGCSQGDEVKNGAVIRLQHSQTGRWLHSHKFQSPLTRAQEVSAFGDNDESNGDDEWKIQLIDGAKTWLQDKPVTFKHVPTGKMLQTGSKSRFSRPIQDHMEVSCAESKAKAHAVTWLAAEGIYFPPRKEDEV